MARPDGYPKVTIKAWRALRTRAAAAPSTRFTPSTVAALMNMSSPKSAADNTVYPMRRLGLIDEEGALTPRGNKWRSDGTYEDACQEILDEIYPNELQSLTGADGLPDPARVRTWFDHRGFGDSNARQMAATYVMIANKKVPDQIANEPKTGSTRQAAQRRTRQPKAPTEQDSGNKKTQPTSSSDERGPNVHLDIQIHIPADADAEQIDQIFASMAKHLYKQ